MALNDPPLNGDLKSTIDYVPRLLKVKTSHFAEPVSVYRLPVGMIDGEDSGNKSERGLSARPAVTWSPRG